MIKPIVKCGVLGLGLLGSVGAWADTTVVIVNNTDTDITNINTAKCENAPDTIPSGKTAS